MHRSHSLDDVSQGLTELAGMLGTRRARRIFQAAVKRGQSPVLSLSAAVSASLVSAAASELNEDPLAGLAAVDDLSALSELCLPGEAYEDGSEHEHFRGARGQAHANGHDKPFYLADPFASPFAKAHAEHASSNARHDRHEQSSHQSSHNQHNAGAGSAQHAGHSMPGGHAGSASGEHSQHGASVLAMSDAVPHGDHHAAITHDASHIQSHGAHSAHAAHNAVSAHANHQSMDVAVQHQSGHAADMPSEQALPQTIADNIDDVSDLIDALPHHAEGRSETAPVSVVAIFPAIEHSHHGSMAMMDMSASDDLAASAPLPMI